MRKLKSWVVKVVFWESSHMVKGDSIQLESVTRGSFFITPQTLLVLNLPYSKHIWLQTQLKKADLMCVYYKLKDDDG
jgi:hypothetical protein